MTDRITNCPVFEVVSEDLREIRYLNLNVIAMSGLLFQRCKLVHVNNVNGKWHIYSYSVRVYTITSNTPYLYIIHTYTVVIRSKCTLCGLSVQPYTISDVEWPAGFRPAGRGEQGRAYKRSQRPGLKY